MKLEILLNGTWTSNKAFLFVRDRMWKYFSLKQGQMRNDPVQLQMSKRKQLFEMFIANE